MEAEHKVHAMQVIHACAEEHALDFETACDLAKQVASHAETEMLLLAWYDRKAGKECPKVPECLHEPGWVAYAESRGANLKVVINDGEYIFLYCPVEKG